MGERIQKVDKKLVYKTIALLHENNYTDEEISGVLKLGIKTVVSILALRETLKEDLKTE